MVEFEPKKKPETEMKPQEIDEIETEEAACSAEFADGCMINED